MGFLSRCGAAALVLSVSACSPPPEDAASLAAALDPQSESARPPTCADYPHEQVVEPATAAALDLALSEATPGTLIRLAARSYEGRFVARASGTASKPIVLCGVRASVLDGGALDTGYVVHLNGADHWILSGFTVAHGKKGIMLDEADHVRLTGLLVRDVGEEAVHFRKASSDNVLEDSEIRDTGRYHPGYGEGVYIGSAISHWADADSPDRSDRNQVLSTRFGPNVTAEHVDIKEGTTGGRIRANVFDGRGISGANFADSWVDVKGNGYRVERNTGTASPGDGFQIHARVSGWGNDNVFSGNVAALDSSGYAFNVDDATSGNQVRCDNQVSGGSGLANVSCVAGEPAEAARSDDPAAGGLDGGLPPSRNFDLSHWKLTLPSGDEVQVDELNTGFTSPQAFYTDAATGGMVFRCPNRAGTTTNSRYSRSELREMLAPGSSASAAENNWTTADGGTLQATLRVDRVSTTGETAKVGRLIIGQIHGVDSEPIRLYFHKTPGEARGRIYAGHDTAENASSFSADIVRNTDGAGIALGEVFSYEIRLVDTRLTVLIRPAAGPAVTYAKNIDPDYRGENLYFKAGVYNQNDGGDDGDYVQATFFALTHAHP